MAKKLYNDVEELDSSNVEVQTPDVKVAPASKKVKIRTVEDIECIVACVPYTFKKDKEYQVPSDVAAILSYAKKAYRL